MTTRTGDSLDKDDDLKWFCEECRSVFDHPLVCWYKELGIRVDALDWFCPGCSGYDVIFKGTMSQEHDYWLSQLTVPPENEGLD